MDTTHDIVIARAGKYSVIDACRIRRMLLIELKEELDVIESLGGEWAWWPEGLFDTLMQGRKSQTLAHAGLSVSTRRKSDRAILAYVQKNG